MIGELRLMAALIGSCSEYRTGFALGDKLRRPLASF